MRVFVDTDCLYTAKTGVRTYVKELVNSLKMLPDIEIVELKRDPNSFFVKNQKKIKPLLHIGRLIWTQISLPLKLWSTRKKGDILISPEYFTPFISPVPNLVTVHDAVFMTRPEDYSGFFKLSLKYVAWPAVRRATKVLTVSNDAKNQISDSLGIDKNQISVTYLGVKAFKKLEKSNSPSFEEETYYLYVGVMEKRKNLPRAIKAFAEVNKVYPNIKFYIVGQSAQSKHFDDTDEVKSLIKDLNLGTSVKLFGYVSDEILTDLYERALGLIFVSTYEGFGLPIVEGYSAGIPVITSKGGATEEVAGGCSLLCDPYNIESISEAMLKLYEQPDLRKKLIDGGKARSKEFTWKNVAEKVVQIGRETTAHFQR